MSTTHQETEKDFNKNNVTKEDRLNNNIDNYKNNNNNFDLSNNNNKLMENFENISTRVKNQKSLLENMNLEKDELTSKHNYTLSINNSSRTTHKSSNLFLSSTKIENNCAILSPVKEVANEVVELVTIPKKPITEETLNLKIGEECILPKQQKANLNEIKKENNFRKNHLLTVNPLATSKQPSTDKTTQILATKSMIKQKVVTPILTQKVAPKVSSPIRLKKHVAFSKSEILSNPENIIINKVTTSYNKQILQSVTNKQQNNITIKRPNLENRMSKSTIVENRKATTTAISNTLKKAKLGSIPNKKEGHMANMAKSVSIVNLTNANNSQSNNIPQLVTIMCQLITKKVGIDFPDKEMTKIAQKLTSGVILCQFINEIRPKTIAAIFGTSSNEVNIINLDKF